ncbi:MAG: hypothetical protein N5P05_000581 [Chroococcopsis gigantea SAG 12.99]|nr:hypothetical protein [Chroococcopsis gigantea SAG 12.99]
MEATTSTGANFNNLYKLLYRKYVEASDQSLASTSFIPRSS